jgi:invasion protein IalB
MTNSTTILYAIAAFVLGALVALGGEHLLFKQKDQRDAMATIAAFQDWRLSCPPRTTKTASCMMQSAIMQKGTSNVVAELNVAPKDKDQSDTLTIVTPLGVVLLAGVKLQIGSGNSKVVQFKTCLQMGCVATLPVDGGLADALSKNDGGVITIMTADGKSVPLNFSLHGYRDAVAARAVDMAARK